MDKDTCEVLFTNDTAFCFIGEINTSDKTDSSGYTGDGEKKYQDQNGTTEWAWKLNPPTVQKIFQLQNDEE